MLVKKINSEWQPSENPHLEVGGLMEITDAFRLIMDGDVVAVDENGQDLSSYDLYGIASPHEMDQFKKWKQMQEAQGEQDVLLAEQARLRIELEAAKAQIPTQPPVEPTVPPVQAPDQPPIVPTIEGASVVDSTRPQVNKKTNWNDMQKIAKELGVWKVRMNKVQAIEAINNA